MLVLIAESKTMSACMSAVSSVEREAHRPVFQDRALAMMETWKSWSNARLAETIKVSPQLARAMQAMIYDFPNFTLGEKAILAYTGVVFRAFDYSSLPEDCRRRVAGKVRIISSLYGWLRPDDIVKPYRLDFTTPMAPPEGVSFASYWREEVTSSLIAAIEEEGSGEVLDLLPADAAKCIDWKIVGQHAKVYKADFKEMCDGGDLRTPRANRLKTLRGLLLRTIIETGLESVKGLVGMGSSCFYVEDVRENSEKITVFC